MSNFLAIATVTATLSRILQAAVGADVPGASVTTARPDGNGNSTPVTGVNIFLYQVSPNAALRNADLPTRRSDGHLVRRPRVPLDLHYLMSFYGDDSSLEPQRLLGSAVTTLHSQPVLSRQTVSSTIADSAFGFLANSDLADEVELVKFTPIPLSLEELSKLWSVFFQLSYTLSVAYQGTVVLLEREETPEPALPVRERNLYVMPFRQPVVEQVVSDAGADEPIVAGGTVIITGSGLQGDVTLVTLGGLEVTPPTEDVSDIQITLALPSAVQAGVRAVQVVHRLSMGTPVAPHAGFESNVRPFVLRPSVTEVSVSNVQSIEGGLRSADVTVAVSPTVGQDQRVVLLLNERSSEAADAHSFAAPPREADAGSVTVPVSGVKAAEYLVRVQVDGAESPLISDTDSSSTTFNQYIAPTVTIDGDGSPEPPEPEPEPFEFEEDF